MNELTSHWVGAWAAASQAIEPIELAGRTIRVIAHVSLGGTRFRCRISNAEGTTGLRIQTACIGLRDRGADMVPGSSRALTFGGAPYITIPAGALVVSDEVELNAAPLSDFAISLFLPSEVDEDFQFTGNTLGIQTNYVSAPGDFASEDDFPVSKMIESYVLVCGVEVAAGPDAGCIVAFGDSLTAGNLSTVNGNHRWPDQLARRLDARNDGRPFGVINQGIGGNRILHDDVGESGLRRFDRDVLAQTGVTHVIIMLGTNDLRNSNGKAEEVVTAEGMIQGLQQLALRAQLRGIKVFGATILTWENETFDGGRYSPSGEKERQALNTWIRKSGTFDAVIDFEAAMRDPIHPTRMIPVFDNGDHLHPNDAGYERMGDIIDLNLF